MEQQAQKLANEFGVSLRRAKQALKTANGVVELAIDEILLTLRNSFASLALVY
jgi:translation elongation factor EF-Ts